MALETYKLERQMLYKTLYDVPMTLPKCFEVDCHNQATDKVIQQIYS